MFKKLLEKIIATSEKIKDRTLMEEQLRLSGDLVKLFLKRHELTGHDSLRTYVNAIDGNGRNVKFIVMVVRSND